MRIALINPPYQTITSNFGTGHQVPLGLLMVGGALIDAGHDVTLIEAEARRLSIKRVVQEVKRIDPDAVMIGHAGSTPAHPVCLETLSAIKAANPAIITIYGGVYPTYHARQILADQPAVDFIVCGEGEATATALVQALERKMHADDLSEMENIAYRSRTGVLETRRGKPISDLDAYRIGWELIDNWDRYHCFGLGRAAIIQLSRGCLHRCTYCGQHGFWVKWRHRNPVRVVDEIEMLCREHGVRFLTIADENPTTLRSVWNAFLTELANRRLPVRFFATIRATDIVREQEALSLWRKAGILYVLMGIETTDPEVIKQINKRSTTRIDQEACRLLRENGILSVLGHIVGLAEDNWRTFRNARRQLVTYPGDFLNAMYVTPHSWTPFGQAMAAEPVAQRDMRKWDYRHQVLGQKQMTPWQLFLAVKWLEWTFHMRPAKLWQMATHPDPHLRRQYRWTSARTRAVFVAEILEFLFRTRFEKC